MRTEESKSDHVADADLDRISCLPDHVIDLILTHLPIREAVKTSVLSSSWRYKWTTLPKLVFESGFFSPASHSPLVMSRIIDHVLLHHSGPIKEFMLLHLDPIDATHIDRWTLHLIGRSIEKLMLVIKKGQRYKIPWRLFSCQSLHALGLYNCWLKPPLTFEGFRNLVALYLNHVTIAQDAFANLIPSCPKLKFLTLMELDGFTEFNINAPNLKHFKLKGKFDDISFENTFKLVVVEVRCDSNESRLYGCSSNLLKFFAHLSDIKQLYIERYFLKYLAVGVVPMKLPSSCINLSYLSLHINFNDLKEISTALCLFRSSPNLQELRIFARTKEQSVPSYCSEDLYSDWPTMQVRHVRIQDISGIKSEFDFTKFVLLHSPVLQSMTVKPVSNVGLELREDLLKFKRASRQAEVIYLDHA